MAHGLLWIIKIPKILGRRMPETNHQPTVVVNTVHQEIREIAWDPHSSKPSKPRIFMVVNGVIITLWLFNIAMENGPFIDGLPNKNDDFPWLC